MDTSMTTLIRRERAHQFGTWPHQSPSLCDCVPLPHPHRHQGVETHAVEPTEKNEFLTDLQQLDSGQMESKVSGLL